ncbi:MAG TPA: SIS domain-containing protein, partial [Myxococcota bacterium]|nr:SIS domain-containing protein [Myxococcota bacterium]
AALGLEAGVQALAPGLAAARSVIFLGTGPGYPVALEGALKLKESACLPAQGYPTQELRHGPVASVGPDTPVVLVHLESAHLDATAALARDLCAAGVPLVVLAARDAERFAAPAQVLALPPAPDLVAPLGATVVLQLLALHVAAQRGQDMDAPPRLVKSVV